jgi:iron complex outermembrane recepter protein
MRAPKTLWIAGISLLALAATPALAQDAADDDTGGIADIVVTAQKKAENLQDVPISVAAIGGETVADLHAASLQGLQGSVPNVEIGTFSNTPNTAVFTIRGIGVIEPDPYAGNTVGIVNDGVPQYFSMGALLDLYDVERIEVLRGPQGTLFGANTTGGVVNVVNTKPKDELGGRLDLSYGNYKHLTIGGVVNVPLSDGLAARFAVNRDKRDGYVTNVVDGSDMGHRNVTIFRGALRYKSGNVDVTLSGEYDRARNGSPIVVAGDLPGEAEFVPAGWRDMYVSPCLPAGSRCAAPDRYFSAHDGGDLGDLPDQSDMDTYRGTLDVAVSDTALGDLTSITSYKKFKLFEFTDQDGTPAALIDTRRQTRGWQFSQELRSDLEIGDTIDLTLGGFYMKTHYDHYQHLRINFAGGASYDLTNDTYTRGLIGLFQRNLQDQDNHSFSLFAQSYLQLSDKLRAQAGIRYTNEKTSMLASTETLMPPATLACSTPVAFGGDPTQCPGSLIDFDATGAISVGNVAPPRGRKSWNNIGWKLGLDYEVSNDTMLYGYWARGFKSGGFTGRIGIAQDLGPYDPEEVDTFEIGLKTDFLDRRVRLNLAAFYTNYRDMQLAQIYFVGSGATLTQGNTILNAAKSNIKGFEAELTVAPTDGLTINSSLAYLDAKYDEFDFLLPSGGTLDLKGERLQNAPKWAATLGARYEAELGEGTKLRLGLNYAYTAEKLLTSILDVPRARIQPQHLLNANADVTFAEHFTVGLWATNLFDNRYMNSVFDAPGTLGLVNYAPPRMYGVSLKAEY